MIRSRFGFILCAGFLSILVGCGSGGDAVGSGDPVTEQSRATFTPDALLLASRESEDVWISADIAGEVDEQLKQIKTKFPEVSDIHTAGVGVYEAMLEVLLIASDSDASWIADWKAGKLHTGEAGLDKVLGEFNAKKVTPLGLEAGNRTWFRIDVAQPLNLVNLGKKLKAASTRIQSVEPNGLVGDGEDVVRSKDKGLSVYTFQLGWGDCPAGCIKKHYWEFTLQADKTITLKEYGDDLDQDAIASGRLAPPAKSPQTPAVAAPTGAPAAVTPPAAPVTLSPKVK